MKKHQTAFGIFIGALIIILINIISGYLDKQDKLDKPILKKVGNITTINGQRQGRGVVDLWEYKSKRNDCLIMISVINGMPSQTYMDCE